MGNRASADADTQRYREGYPGKEDDLYMTDNWDFYSGRLAAKPYPWRVDEIHARWFGKYETLEYEHAYIQWLFPIREQGLNCQASELQLHEAEKIKNDPKAMARFVWSYKMMLDFYGMDLVDDTRGRVARSQNHEERFQNLNTSSHNFLRMTRILKSLGEIGLEHFKLPLLKFFAKEIYEEKTLQSCRRSFEDYWVPTLRIDSQLEEMRQIIPERPPSPTYDYRSKYGGVGLVDTISEEDDAEKHAPEPGEPVAAGVAEAKGTEKSEHSLD